MARGVEFDALDKRWTLRMNMAAMCLVERQLKVTFSEAVEALKTSSMVALLTLFGAALGGKLTEERAGDIVDDLGLEKAVTLLGEAINLAFPQEDAADPDAGK